MNRYLFKILFIIFILLMIGSIPTYLIITKRYHTLLWYICGMFWLSGGGLMALGKVLGEQGSKWEKVMNLGTLFLILAVLVSIGISTGLITKWLNI